MKPIIFNTEMVRAILDGRKTVTRRVIKPQPENVLEFKGISCITDNIKTAEFLCESADKKRSFIEACKMPYKIGDILYVRETWTPFCINKKTCSDIFLIHSDYCFKASPEDIKYGCCDETKCKWRPSIHMPKEAARIFLRITNIWIERLQDMTEDDVYDEGADQLCDCPDEREIYLPEGGIEACWSVLSCPNCPCDESYPETFGKRVWDKTIKKSDLDRYGWNANPWVWVIEFERISKEEAYGT